MKKQVVWLLGMIIIMSFTACENRISLKKAKTLIRSHISRNYPWLPPKINFELFEITTNESWNLLNMQIFKIYDRSSDYVGRQTYIIKHRTVFKIGEEFGFEGVSETMVLDLDDDKKPELIYIYTTGSGNSYSYVALLKETSNGFCEVIMDAIFFSTSIRFDYIEGDLHVFKNYKARGIDRIEYDLGIVHYDGEHLYFKVNDLPDSEKQSIHIRRLNEN